MMSNKHERILAAIYVLAKFCPLCGKDLIETEQVLWATPVLKSKIKRDVKACPDGHGAMVADGEYGPQLTFEVSEELVRDC